MSSTTSYKIIPINNQMERYEHEILEIFNDNIMNSLAIYEEVPSQLEDINKWFHTKNNHGFPILAAVNNDNLLGFCSYDYFLPQTCFKYTVSHSLYVHKNFRRVGIGQKLLESIIFIAKQKEYKNMIAYIDSTNIESLKLHLKLGFEVKGLLPNVAYKFEKWRQVNLLQLEL